MSAAASSAQTIQEAPGAVDNRRWLGLAVLSLGVSMIIVDATIVNVSVPSIIRDLGLSATAAEWVNTGYSLVFAALLVTVGRLGDVVGRRRMYLLGLLVFVGASMLAGLAPTGEILVLARFAQGAGGAMILPATQSILNTNFRGRDRVIAFGIWGAVIGGTAALGPLLGGWLTTNLNWRWAFLINLPIGIIAALGTLRWIRESRDETAKPGFDLPGFLLITYGLSGIIFALIEGQTYGWWTQKRPFEVAGLTWPTDWISIVPVAMITGLIALGLFAMVETRRLRAGKFYLVDFGLWRYRAFRYGNFAGTIVSLGEFGLLFVLPLFLQAVLELTAFETGLVFLSLAIGSFLAAPFAIKMSRRFGPRRVVTLGMALEAIGILATTLPLAVGVSALVLVLPLFVYGIGVGFATAQLTNIALSDVPVARSGVASGANSTMRQIGSALGIAILGTVLLTTLGSQTRTNLAAIPGLPPAAAEGIATAIESSAGQALVQIRTQPGADVVVPAIESAFVDAARLTGTVAFAFVLLGLLCSLLLPDTREVDERARPLAVAAAPPPV